MLSIREIEVLAFIYSRSEPVNLRTIDRQLDITSTYVHIIMLKFSNLGLISSRMQGRCKIVSIKNERLARACLDLVNECRKLS